MENTNDILDGGSGAVATGQRPVFLKVLCILTFVGSGLGIIGALIGLMTAGMTEESMRLSQSLMSDSPFNDLLSVNFEEMMRWQKYSQLASLGGSLLCLTGALMMWRLKKIGYFLYIPGWIIPLAVSAMATKYIMTGWLASFGVAGIVLNVIIAAAFIVMYGLNVKHMK